MKILMPIDDSPFSQLALQFLISQMNTRGAQVRVLHVIDPVAAYMTAGLVPEITVDTAKIEAERRKEGKALIERTSQKLRRAGFRTTQVLDFGDGKTCILDQAENWGADLIVLGSHGLRGLTRFLMGSVSEAVVRHAKCSVILVRKRETKKTKSS
jgi:nucleotide-binding universal stress UspA family protein